MSYDRQLSPPGRSGWDGGPDTYGRDRDGPPSASPSYSRRGDDTYAATGGNEDPYGYPRRGRSPDDDRRKRRRSPSPRGGTDTYIPSYHRERSPGYRDSRRGDSYYGGSYNGGGWGGDRYDSRAGSGRDPYDAYGATSSNYDRRPPANLPSRRSNMKPPQDLPYLASFGYYRDWIRDEDHRLYEDKDKLNEAYKKYKAGFLYKHQKAFFEDIKDLPWCKERYGVGAEEVAERKKLRERGREGKMDAFLATLESGELDDLSFDQKVIASGSPPKKETKLESMDENKPETPDEPVKAEEDTVAKIEVKDEAIEEDKKEESKDDDALMGENGHGKTEGNNDEAKPENDENGQTAKVEEDKEAADQFEDASRKGDEDSIVVPPAPTTLFIKSLSPEISRADLIAHCKQVEGFDYVALGEPNPAKRFHRIGWVVFKPDADMEQAVEKLCESKINNFTLHMHLSDKPGYQRIRVAPTPMSSIERIRQSLEHVKQIVSNMESEAADDRGSKAIAAKIATLSSKFEAEKPAETGDSENLEAWQEQAEKVDRLTLDLHLQYLRSVFHTCYYCVSTYDFAEELTRKCVKHVRRYVPPGSSSNIGKNKKENEAIWIERFDEKIQLLINRDAVDPVDYGGESYQEELTKICKPNIQVEDEGKFRCKVCKKLFKAAPFVEKHILNKHPELIGDRLEQLKYYNNFVLDPAHPIPSIVENQSYSNNPNHPSNGQYNFSASGMANTLGAFNQMFNSQFGGMMNYMFQPLTPGFGNFNGGAPGMYSAGGAMPMSGPGRALGDRIGGRGDDYGMRGMNGGAKRPRRGSFQTGGPPPPPPKGARIDPRAGKVHAYTDLDGPPAGGGGDDMILDY